MSPIVHLKTVSNTISHRDATYALCAQDETFFFFMRASVRLTTEKENWLLERRLPRRRRLHQYTWDRSSSSSLCSNRRIVSKHSSKPYSVGCVEFNAPKFSHRMSFIHFISFYSTFFLARFSSIVFFFFFQYCVARFYSTSTSIVSPTAGRSMEPIAGITVVSFGADTLIDVIWLRCAKLYCCWAEHVDWTKFDFFVFKKLQPA